MILDVLDNARCYEDVDRGLRDALRWLSREDLSSLPPGRHEIHGERLYAIVQQYRPQPAEGRQLESHRRYIDVQFLLSGREAIYWAPLSGVRHPGEYSEDKDAALHADRAEESDWSMLLLAEGSFAVFFPEDAHLPGCLCPGAAGHSEAEVRKIVVKVRVRDG